MMACASMPAENLRSMRCVARKCRVRNLLSVEAGPEAEPTWYVTAAIHFTGKLMLRNKPMTALRERLIHSISP